MTGPGLVCLGERATFSCTIMGSTLTWRYSEQQVGGTFTSDSSTLDTINRTENDIMFTVTYISTDNGTLVSSLSFIAVMETNGQMITCFGASSRDDAIIQEGSGEDHQPYTCTCT